MPSEFKPSGNGVLFFIVVLIVLAILNALNFITTQ